MTTVGYGDYYPKTVFGRAVGVMLCLWGTWIVSLFVVSIQVTLKLTPAEEKTYQLLLRLKSKEVLKKTATFVLQAAFKGK